MRHSILAAALSVTVLATGVAIAQSSPAPATPRPLADGVLTRDEALAMADKRFERLDFNRDGRVSEETMAATNMGKRGGPRGPGMRGHRGGDRAEMARPAGPKPDRQARFAERFQTLDANRDGQLTRDEFRAQAAKRFATTDANNDGRIDQAERFAAREKMREQRRAARPST